MCALRMVFVSFSFLGLHALSSHSGFGISGGSVRS